ncbi:MAG: metallophosphoesterase family protein [Bacteroidia bacterium]
MTIAEHTIDSRNIVVGDIHGCCKSFRNLVSEVIKLTRKDTLILLGDYIDKGPDSKGVLDFIIELKREGYEVIALRGNHEELLIKTLDGDKNAEQQWLDMGGEEALLSFNVSSAHEIPEDYIVHLKRMGYYLEMDEAYIVHAGFNFEISDPFSDKEAMLTIRGYKPDKTLLKGKKIIHGHTPIKIDDVRKQIIDNNTLINIDAGCVFSGKEGKGYLVAVELGSWKLYETKNAETAIIQ